MTNFEFSLTRRDLMYIGLIALAVVLWFHAFFIRGEVLVPPNANSVYPWYGTEFYTDPHPQGSMDAVRENYITWALHDRYIEEGYSPTWQPYFLTGNPLLANQFAIPYSPFKLLNYLFSAPVAWSWGIVLKSFFNGLFTYLALRALMRGYTASTIGALAWMLSWALAHQTETTYSEGVALMPAVFFLTLRSYQVTGWRKQAAYGMLAAVFAGFQFLAGNIQMTVYSFLLLAGFALYWAWDQNRETRNLVGRLRPLWTLGLVYAGGVLVGAVQLWSSYELLSLSIRGVAQTHANRGIEPYTEISFLNPWIYFWRNFEFPELREKYWLNYRWNPYIGLLPLLMVGVALRFVRDRIGRAVLWMTMLVFIALHLLYPKFVFNLLSRLPGYDALDQTRLLIVLSFPLAIVAAYGVDWFLDEASKPEHWRKLRVIVALGCVVVVLMAIGMAVLMVYFEGEREAAQQLGDSFVDQRIKVGTEIIADYYAITNPLFAASFVFALGVLGMVVAYAKGWLNRPRTEWVMIGLTAVDLILFAQVNVASNKQELVYPATPAIEFLQDHMQDDIFRISAAPNTLYEGRDSGDFSTYRDDHGWYMASATPILVPNTPALFGLQDIRGYESVYTLKYSEYMARLDGREEPFGAFVAPSETVQNPMVDALNVRYILALPDRVDDENPTLNPSPPVGMDLDSSLELVYDGEIRIYENPNALPRAMVFFDYDVLADDAAVLDAMAAADYDPFARILFGGSPDFDLPPEADLAAQAATISTYEPDRVVIQTDIPQAGILMLGDENYPGWVAEIDGETVPITTANYLMRAVGVPAGQHRVEFRYESRGIQLTEWVSLVSGIALLMGAGVLLGSKSYAVFQNGAKTV